MVVIGGRAAALIAQTRVQLTAFSIGSLGSISEFDPAHLETKSSIVAIKAGAYRYELANFRTDAESSSDTRTGSTHQELMVASSSA